MSMRILVLIAAAAFAAIPLGSGAVDQALISPGDTLSITVLGEPDYSKQVIVDDDGRIFLPLVKDVSAGGKTTAQVADAVAEALGKFLKNPDVTVELVQKARKQVTVTGQVQNPGVYPLERGTRLMEVVGLAGGFTQTADTAKVAVTRRGQAEAVTCDLKTFLAGRTEEANLVLQDGDVILVPDSSPTLGTVFVYGTVRQPGQPIQIREGMRVSQAVSAAGGIIPEQADTSRAILKRAGQADPVQIDLAKALSGDPSADLTLEPGDTITVPTLETTGTFTIYGAVANSGEYPLRDKLTIARAIAAAGGPTPRAKISDLRITRTDGSGKAQSVKVDLKKISNGNAADVAVQPGDTIYVPESPERPDRSRIFAIGATLLGILLR